MKRFDLKLTALISGFIAFAFYFVLPDQVPYHFNAVLMPDRFGPKLYVVTFFAFLPIVLSWGFTRISERLSPGSEQDAMLETSGWVTAMFIAIQVVTYLSALQDDQPYLAFMLPLIIGLSFIGMGNIMPRLPQSRFIGIRTKATLSSEAIWRKTNRMGGRLFVALGIAICGVTPFSQGRSGALLLTGVTVVGVLSITIWSWWYSEGLKSNTTAG